MTGYLTVNFSETEEGLFSTREILRLMRVEYERARRYVYPASLMVVEVDRLEYLHNLYGWESKEEILQSVIKLLRSTTRDSDFLGCLQDARILAVFPHTSAEAISGISTRLLRSRCRICLQRIRHPSLFRRCHRSLPAAYNRAVPPVLF